jgi:hypothetical protein
MRKLRRFGLNDIFFPSILFPVDITSEMHQAAHGLDLMYPEGL